MTPFGKAIVGVLIIGIIGGSFYFVNKKNAIPNSTEVTIASEVVGTSTSSQATTTLTTGKKMAFSEFIKQDKSAYMCDVNQEILGASTKGTVYISNGKIRGEFTNSASGTSMTAFMVVKDGYSYAWSTVSSSTGIKFKSQNDVDTTFVGELKTLANLKWNPKDVGDYTCKATVLEESTFSLPKNILFSEIIE